MQKKALVVSENGDRIYDKVQVERESKSIKDFYDWKVPSSSSAKLTRLSEPKRYENLVVNTSKTDQIGTEQVLDVLDYHINSLNKLQSQRISTAATTCCSVIKDLNENDQSSVLHQLQLDLSTIKTSSSCCAKCTLDRRLVLDQYLSDSIKGKIECECLFQHELDDHRGLIDQFHESLTNGSCVEHSETSASSSPECIRAHNENKRIVKRDSFSESVIALPVENSPHLGNTLSSKQHEAVYLLSREKKQQDQQKQSEARSSGKLFHGLFIEETSEGREGCIREATCDEQVTGVLQKRKHFYDNKSFNRSQVLKQTQAKVTNCCSTQHHHSFTDSVSILKSSKKSLTSSPEVQAQTLQVDSWIRSDDEALNCDISSFSPLLLNADHLNQDELLEIITCDDEDEELLSEPGNVLEGLSDSLTCNSDRESSSHNQLDSLIFFTDTTSSEILSSPQSQADSYYYPYTINSISPSAPTICASCPVKLPSSFRPYEEHNSSHSFRLFSYREEEEEEKSHDTLDKSSSLGSATETKSSNLNLSKSSKNLSYENSSSFPAISLKAPKKRYYLERSEEVKEGIDIPECCIRANECIGLQEFLCHNCSLSLGVKISSTTLERCENCNSQQNLSGNKKFLPSKPSTLQRRLNCCCCLQNSKLLNGRKVPLEKSFGLLSCTRDRDRENNSTVTLEDVKNVHVKSMRAAKDVAKLSIPSLSALQYLPNQIDSSKILASFDESNKSSDRKSLMMMKKSNKSERNNLGSSLEQARKVTKENDNYHSSESSLLKRLCSCNCLAKSQQNMQNLVETSDSSQVNKAEKSNFLAKNLRHSSSSSSRKSLNSKIKDYLSETDIEGNGSSSCVSTNVTAGTRGRSESLRSYEERSRCAETLEKQSPRFLDILRGNSELDDGRRNSSRRKAKRDIYGQKENQEDEKYVKAASVGTNSPLSSSQADSSSYNNANTTTDESACSSTFHRTRSTSFASERFRVESSLDSRDETRPHSACSVPKETAKRSSSFRKFLSPSRLFSSSNNSSKESIPPSKNNPDTSELTNRAGKENLQPETQSFLVRSLNRLSERKGSPRKSFLNRKKKNNNKKPTEEENTINVIRCPSASPSISISICDDSLTESVNSLDNELPQLLSSTKQRTKLSQAPEIVLDQVRYTTSLDLSSSSSVIIPAPDSSEMGAHRCVTAYISPNNLVNEQSHPNCLGDAHLKPVEQQNLLGGSCEFLKPDCELPLFVQRTHSLPASPFASRRKLNGTSRPPTSHSPIPFHSPVTQSSKIEDGLKVCSSEHFEKHIGNIKDTQIAAQKRLFHAWINHFSPNLIQQDLFDELKDGIKLIGLLASLTHDPKLYNQYQKLVQDKQSVVNRLALTPRSRLKHLSNVSIAIEYLRQKLGMKLINLNPMDIVSGKSNVILGLCWNIILKFQLEENTVHYLDQSQSNNLSFDDGSRHRTSRLSGSFTNEDGGNCKSTKERKMKKLQTEFEEYSLKDLVLARKKLLAHVNKRFNLKLTNLTSNLMDGDVLLVILRQLIGAQQPDVQLDQFFVAQNDGNWENMTNDEKLDYCFSIAQIHLGIPRLFDAKDLKQQTISDNNSKPLLVYLSMLLNTNSKGEPLELAQRKLSTDCSTEQPDDDDLNSIARRLLNSIDREDKFALERLQTTLAQLEELERLTNSSSDSRSEDVISDDIRRQVRGLRESANQIESLINWINEADNLFETTSSSAPELSKAIQEYSRFFSPENIPKVSTPLCSTLERQYRECLSMAKQKILNMEQTFKNMDGCEKSQRQLKEWLNIAESKLHDALIPEDVNQETISVDHLSKCLEDLIQFFELEETELDELTSVPEHLSINHEGDSLSISGSVLSLASNCSKASTLLQLSKKAKYTELFNDFELKSRLLATMLDSNQKDALLLAVKELRNKLRYITEQRVPEIVNDLRLSIEQSKKQVSENIENENIEEATEDVSSVNQVDLDIPDLDLRDTSNYQTETKNLESSIETSRKERPKLELKSARINKIRTKKQTTMKSDCEIESKKKKSTKQLETNSTYANSLFGWLFHEEVKPIQIEPVNSKKKQQQQQHSNYQKNSNKKHKTKKTSVKVNEQKPNSEPDEVSYIRLFWNKIVRAYKASVSLNIVLLICLAGICVVPLIQQNACCELRQSYISSNKISMNEKPT